MSGRNNFNARELALGAMLIALSVVLAYIGAVTEVLDLSLCAIASLITVFAKIEFGTGYAYMVYGATSVLSFLLLPNKMTAFIYVFCALYSIIKANMEKCPTILSWVFKLLYVNVVAVAGFFAGKYLFMLPDETDVGLISLFLLGNAAFILFDIAITRLITAYARVFRHRLGIDKFLKSVKRK